ncbi:MAG: MlaE family lipid ABC transporter permease subunit [Gammaproteobacteria bacterium]|nr:MlaE family lipid ABC transporter permease subunit [Gammaproteobacteria bacterium]
MTVKDANSERVVVAFAGRLDLDSVADYWRRCLKLLDLHTPEIFAVDVSGLSYCDSAAIALLLEIKKRQSEAEREFELKGLTARHEELINAITNSSHKPSDHEMPPQEITMTIGRIFVNFLGNVRDNITFVGMVSYYLFQSLMRPKTIRWKDFWYILEDVGPNALPIIVLIGFLVGLISAFQSAVPLGRFGAQIYIINLVGIGLVKEMGPLMTAVILAGRTASAFAAEIGTMKIDQELDALTTMGLEPVRFLTIPRIMATTLMTPLLNIFLIFFGLVGASLVTRSLGYNFPIFMHQLYSAVPLKDLVGGMLKAIAFGFVIASVGCMHGLKTRFGASAVGNSTTQAVVASLVMIVIVDGIFATIYYVLGV